MWTLGWVIYSRPSLCWCRTSVTGMAPGLLELLLVSAFLVDATHLNSSGPGQDEHFTHQLVLDKEEKVHLSWRTSR